MTARRMLGLALLAWIIVVALGLVFGAPLTGDESAYALLARGTDATWLYRPRGMVVLAQLGVALGGSDVAMRLGSALLSVGFVAGVAAVGRRAFGATVGAWAALVVAGSHAFVLRAPELLGDVPAAACMLAAVAIVIGELDRDGGPRYRLVLAAPALAAAFYLRYGSVPVIGLIGGVAIVLWWRAVIARPGPVIATIVVLGALLAPFAIVSLHATGSPLGILALSRDVASRDDVGHGLRVFLLDNPFRMYGAMVPPVLIAGLVALVRPPPQRRAAWYLVICAVGQIVAIGIVGHGSVRYVFFALGLLIVVGVDAIARVIAARPSFASRGPRIAGGALVLAWLGLAIAQVPLQHHMADGLAELVADAHAIRADAAGQPCTVAARAVPQMMWYSGCDGVKLGDDAITAVDLPAGRRWYTASAPRRPVDAAAIGRVVDAEPVALPAPSAWRLVRASH